MINFENTEIAFQSKNAVDLNLANVLFSAMRSNALVVVGSAFTKVALAANLPVGWAVKPTVYKHFVGGETINECKPAIDALKPFNVKALLDYSVEGMETDDEINAALEETLRTIENAAKEVNVPFAVFKPTAFTKSSLLTKVSDKVVLTNEDKKQFELYIERVDKLCKRAFELKVPILVDAEDSWYQQAIDDVVGSMMEKYNKESAIVFNTYQMYRHDRLAVLHAAHKSATEKGYLLGAKFVRGAYMEKEHARAQEEGYPDPIQPDKDATDRDYNAAIKYSIENIENISVFNGTHNENSSNYMIELMKENGIASNDTRCWFSQLYGMSDNISFNLAHEGFNVVKYLPYGPVSNVLPYLLRRIEENSSVASQTSRELSLIRKEKSRRKQAK